MAPEQPEKITDPAHVSFDGEGAVRAFRFGTVGTLAAGAGAAAAAGAAWPLLVIGAIPIIGGAGSAAYGYFTAKDVAKRRARDRLERDEAGR